MVNDYEEAVAGLESGDAQIVLDGAIWLIENPDKVQDQSFYMKASELLYTAALENIDCLRYIAEKIVHQIAYKAQQLASLAREEKCPQIQQEAKKLLHELTAQVLPMKAGNTEMIAQIYSAIQETGYTELIQDAKKLL
jgi:hypothetical protein